MEKSKTKNCAYAKGFGRRRQKSKIWGLFCLLIFAFILMLGGCGERIESTSYYYNPSWTKDGKIIFVYGLESTRKDVIGTRLGYSYTETLMTMDSGGTGESSLFEVTGNPPWAMSCSPTRNYVAYLDQKIGDEFGKLIVGSVSPEAARAMRKFELSFYPRIRSFDWSPDGNKIVYCTSSEVRIRNWLEYNGSSDQLVTSESDISFVSWKYGNLIAFTHGSPEVLSLIDENGGNRIDLVNASVSKPQISPTSTNEIFGIYEGKFCKVDTTLATREVIFPSFKGNLPRLSPDGKKVVYDKIGESSGIYILDLTASSISETKIK